MQGYLVQAPGHTCTRCGGDISYYPKAARYCSKCRKEVDHELSLKRTIRRKELEDRDTAKPIHSDVTFTYDRHMNVMNVHRVLLCPVCGHALYAKTNFCDNCGQRLKEEVVCQTSNVAFSVESSKRKTNSENIPTAEKTELKEDIEPAKAAKP